MILTGPQIKKEVEKQSITISPFDPRHLNPNSYNFSLGDKIKTYNEKIIDPKKINKVKEIVIPSGGLVLSPRKLYLGHIAETIGSEHFVPIIKGRSSVGRMGLFIVITADLIDLGAIGKWTLQLHAIQPVRIYKGMRIGQMTFWKTSGKKILYKGKYQGATGPQETLAYKDIGRPSR